MTQDTALEILKRGHNVFLTGAAGSGKTYVLNKYIEYLNSKKIKTAITASTGIAATHINGMTIHSWCGIGIKDEISDRDIEILLDKNHLRLKFLNNKVLIVDEISMLHSHRLDMIDKVCRAFKFNDRPFGGMQIVMCGDFFQLPPVSRGQEPNDFAFESNVWNEAKVKVCYLSEQHRQSDDSLLTILNDIRNETTDEHTLIPLRTRYKKEIVGAKTPTKLYTHNIDVDGINAQSLGELIGDTKTFITKGSGKRDLVEILKKSCLAPEQLELKRNAVVMFVKNNYESGFVNGTLGTVVDFDKESGYPIVLTRNGTRINAYPERWAIEDEGTTRAEIKQIPLRLAWAITIHKSQGMTLDAAEIDLSKTFVPGMGYVALSRVRTLDSMKLIGFNQMALAVNQKVANIDREFKKESEMNEKVFS
jgi:ATP-dependent DNA helicase PIF1